MILQIPIHTIEDIIVKSLQWTHSIMNTVCRYCPIELSTTGPFNKDGSVITSTKLLQIYTFQTRNGFNDTKVKILANMPSDVKQIQLFSICKHYLWPISVEYYELVVDKLRVTV